VQQSFPRSLLMRSTALAAVLLGFPGVVAAQTASENSDADAIIVTGSRIPRPETEAANPVMTLSAQDIVQSGTTNITDYLKTLPALVGSQSSYNNSGDRAGIGFTGLNLLDLRNLGYDRTLVLVDGRRHIGSADGLQSVDINTIPSDLIERVEVSTGGASAIYGADGVSGVVNFIQKKDFEGLTARVQAGISGQGDAGQRLIALTGGHNFADGRGNIAIAWEHGEEDRLDVHQRSRYAGSNRIGFFKNPNGSSPAYVPLNDIRYYDTSRQGGIDVDFDGLPDFYGSQGLPFDHGSFVPDFYQQGGSATLVSDYGNDLLPQIRRDIVSGLAHFDVSDALTVYAEAKYAKTRSYTLGQPTFDYYLFIPQDNPYIPAAVRPFIDPVNGGVLVNRDNFDLGQRGEDVTRETIRTVLGAKGNLAPNLSYDISWVYGRAKITNHYIGDRLTDRFMAAIDAVDQGAFLTGTPNGNITCRVNLDPTTATATTFRPGDCIPLNLFGENVNSAAAVNWIKTDTTDRLRLTQNAVSGSLTGNTDSFLKLPGGPVGFALGGEYRKETSNFVADPLAQQGLTFGNILGNTAGKFDVWEAFGEVSLPLLADRPFFQRLEVNGAVRYSDYSTIGTTTAWKVGGNWAPVKDIAFRGTYSKAVRAPNISELFGANSQTFEFINDPCTASNLNLGTQYRVANCQALLSGLGVANPATYVDTRSTNLPGFSGGNPNVKEETAKTWTAGVVIQPRFAPRLLITADWYDINIKNAINTVTPQKLADLCVDQPTLANQYCAAITRQNGGTNAGFVTSFNIAPLNVANFKTAGLDVALDYSLPTERAGTFKLHVVGNYLHRLTFVPIPGSPLVNEAYQSDGPSPKFQVTSDIGWQYRKFSLNYRVRYFSKTYRFTRQQTAANPDIVAPEYLKLNQRFSHDIYLSAEVNDRFEFYGGVDNVFNQKPTIGTLNTPVSAVGRFLYIGARVKLADLFK